MYMEVKCVRHGVSRRRGVSGSEGEEQEGFCEEGSVTEWGGNWTVPGVNLTRSRGGRPKILHL